MTSEAELLPCPFCGSGEASANEAFGDWWVGCPCHHSSGFHLTEEAARDAWNTRATPPAQGETVAFGASEAACILYPGDDEGPLRAAYIAGAATAPPPVGEGVSLALREAQRMMLNSMRSWAYEMIRKHANPNGTDYEQGQNDMGHRWVASIDEAIAANHGGEG